MSSWPDAVTFCSAWQRSVATRADKPFLIFENDSAELAQYSYAEFDLVVDELVSALSGCGIGPGDSIHLALTNSPWFVAIWLSAAKLGATIVSSDPMAGSTELAGHRQRTNAKVGFCSKDRLEAYSAAVTDGTSFVAVDEQYFDVNFAASLVTDALAPIWLGDRSDWSAPQQLQAPGLRDRLGVMFTSGTTGQPKGVEISQANYAFAGKAMTQSCGLTADDRQLVVLPLFHANAQYYSFASAIWVGASVALVHKFSASGFLRSAKRLGATHASLFAAPIRMILAKAEPIEGFKLSHCWFAQNLTRSDYAHFADLIACQPRQLYGMTETIAAVLTDRSDFPEPDLMGTPTPGCVVGVLGDRLVVGGEPGITLFSRYLDDPETTAASFDEDGWFETGDRASVDAAGRYRFGGRRSDVLKVAGENVSIVEIETVLAEHAGVADVAVIGVPDHIRDEVPVAFIVAKPSQSLDVADLEAHSLQRLAKAKRPTKFIVVDELPRTSVGKIKKFLLTEPPGEQDD